MTSLLSLPVAPSQRKQPGLPAMPVRPSVSQPEAGLRPRSRVVVGGMIQSSGTVTVGGSNGYRLTLADRSGELDVLFLGRPSVRGLQPGTRITVEGTVGTYHGKPTIWNPRYLVEPTP